MKITGVMIYYYFICKRKLWYFTNKITMEQNSELVAIGKVIDETSYRKEKKSILIDDTINIDFVKNGAVLHEVKKTKAIEEAGIWQMKYYMYYLEQKGIENIEAKIDYPLLRKTKEIFLTSEDKIRLDKAEIEILKTITENKPPRKVENKICKKCAYYDLCYI